ncbi:MAG: SpoIID/LytB domain-containing protein [Nitrospirae bacterium]|nr:SpoIID/LytB domain-containing protein [Nitrospirota bacterium]
MKVLSSQFSAINIKISCLFFFVFILIADSCLLPADVFANTIKVLILDENYPKIPEKDEQLEKVSDKIKGDLLLSGIHYKGEIEVWKGQNGLYIINEVPFEDYVKSVVQSEVGTNWEMEALKVQAVISRTYALYQKNMNGNSFYHLTSSVLHQVYKGNSSDPRIAYAVEHTEGEILTFNNKPIEALYHSTCGGRTESPEEVFGKSSPYLKPVESSCEESPYWVWERKIPLSEIEKSLHVSGIKDIKIKSFTSTDRAKDLCIDTESEQITIKATEFRKLLGWQRLPSTKFSLVRDGDSMILEGKGYGHGVGLCQWSALEMAKKGKTYREILSFFYPGTEIQLYEGR